MLELAGRLGSPVDGTQAGSGAGAAAASGREAGGRPGLIGALTWKDQVRTGLVNLGWQPRDAEQAIAMVEPDLLAASRGAGASAADHDGADHADCADGAEGTIDVAVALRAVLRALGRT